MSNDKFSYKCARIKVTDEIIRYDSRGSSKVGCLLMSQRLEAASYFEIKILETGIAGCISIGAAPYDYPLDCQPGWRFGSFGFHADDGRLYKYPGQSKVIGPRCKVGDKLGCGIRKLKQDDRSPFAQLGVSFGGSQNNLLVYFTVNGKEIGSTSVVVPDHVTGLHPAIGMNSDGEAVEVITLPGVPPLHSQATVDDFMLVDDGEDEWIKVHDVRVNGQIIEYAGNGVHIHDVGLAQAKNPLTTRNHYFEIEILEPGEHCYIAIGLIHKNYPLHRHPGWNDGSIAYHADDGKIFLGKGQGTPFGPRCYRGDVMGCGIQFPFEYVTPSNEPDTDEDDIDEDEESKIEEDPIQPQDFPLPMPFINNVLDVVDDGDPFDIKDDLLGSGDEDDFWPQYGKLEDEMQMNFIIESGLGQGNIDGLFDDRIRRGPIHRRRGRGGMLHGRRASDIYKPRDKSVKIKVFFTRNGYMIGHKEVLLPKDGFYPAIGMLSLKEKVRVDLRPLTG